MSSPNPPSQIAREAAEKIHANIASGLGDRGIAEVVQSAIDMAIENRRVIGGSRALRIMRNVLSKREVPAQ